MLMTMNLITDLNENESQFRSSAIVIQNIK